VLAGAFASQKMTPFIMAPRKDNLLFLNQLIEAGEISPVIERAYPLAEAAEAVRHIAEGHAQGKTVITMFSEEK
jgi:NADPH:quinone reductase-like Zn-dependent oxidoreductase